MTGTGLELGYVLPDPGSYADWAEFEADLACVADAGYDAAELQIADPAALDEARLRRSLEAAGLRLPAFQTGTTYATRGNCLCTADAEVRARTVALLESFVDLAARWGAVMVFGSLQGRATDEPDRDAGRRRIVEAMSGVCRYAARRGAVIAFEPVNHLEVAWHNTIDEVRRLVRELDLPSARMMIDTFHMNIEEAEMLAALPGIAEILVHVHLSETNRGVLGSGHWDTRGLLAGLRELGYEGCCSVGVYNTTLSRRESTVRCMEHVRACL